MLERQRVLGAFKTALIELELHTAKAGTTFTKVADRARQVYSRDRPEGAKPPSIWTFRSYLLGRRSDPEIVALVAEIRIAKTPRIDRTRLIDSFRRAIEGGLLESEGKLRPRTVAVRAHRIYCETLSAGERRPALVSFTQRVTGKTADASVLQLLKSSGIESGRHAKLNRDRLVTAFRECLKRFESRIMKGVARPLHVADGAHEIYSSQSSESERKPSRLTFRRLVYGQGADPEIASLLQLHFHRTIVSST